MLAAWLLIQKLLLEGKLPAFQYFDPQMLVPCPDLFMLTKAMLHKAAAWDHEREWRMSFSCVSNEMNQQEHPWARKRSSAVYLGRNISPIHEKILRHLAVEKGIPIYKMTIPENEVSYNLRPIQI